MLFTLEQPFDRATRAKTRGAGDPARRLESPEGYKYDSATLADGQARKLIRGVHFDCKPESFKVSAYLHARKHRWPTPLVEITEDGNEVLLQFRKRRQRARGKPKAKVEATRNLEVSIKQSAADLTIRIRAAER